MCNECYSAATFGLLDLWLDSNLTLNDHSVVFKKADAMLVVVVMVRELISGAVNCNNGW